MDIPIIESGHWGFNWIPACLHLAQQYMAILLHKHRLSGIQRIKVLGNRFPPILRQEFAYCVFSQQLFPNCVTELNNTSWCCPPKKDLQEEKAVKKTRVEYSSSTQRGPMWHLLSVCVIAQTTRNTVAYHYVCVHSCWQHYSNSKSKIIHQLHKYHRHDGNRVACKPVEQHNCLILETVILQRLCSECVCVWGKESLMLQCVIMAKGTQPNGLMSHRWVRRMRVRD